MDAKKIYELLDLINESNIRPILTKIVAQEEELKQLHFKIDKLTNLVEKLNK